VFEQEVIQLRGEAAELLDHAERQGRPVTPEEDARVLDLLKTCVDTGAAVSPEKRPRGLLDDLSCRFVALGGAAITPPPRGVPDPHRYFSASTIPMGHEHALKNRLRALLGN
jgi:hypothetical protein